MPFFSTKSLGRYPPKSDTTVTMAYRVKMRPWPRGDDAGALNWSWKYAGAQNRKNHHTPSVRNLPTMKLQVCLKPKHFMKGIDFSSDALAAAFASSASSWWMYSSSASLTCLLFSGLSYMNCQRNIQRKPRPPMMMKAHSQPRFLASGGIRRGAASAPTDAPALKMEVANARSFLGKYSAVVLMAAGKLPDSPSARMPRQRRNRYTLTVEMVSATLEPASTALRAATESTPSTNQVVATPQPACITAPRLHTPMAMR